MSKIEGKKPDPYAEQLLNRPLQSQVDEVLASKTRGSELLAEIQSAERTSGDHLSIDEEESFIRLKDGLLAQDRLSPELEKRIDDRISAERALRAKWIQNAYSSGSTAGQVAATAGMILAAVLGIGLGASDIPSDPAGLYAGALSVDMILAMMLGRGLPAIGAANAERYGVNEFEPKQAKKLAKLAEG